jgi:hypothetical protein
MAMATTLATEAAPGPAAARRIRARLSANKVKLDLANVRLRKLEAERTELYRQARQTGADGNPLVTFKDIAAIYGVTEAAVMQKAKRAGI